MKIYFDTPHLYYITQFLPIYREAGKRGHEGVFCFYPENGMEGAIERVIQDEGLPVMRVRSDRQALECYRDKRPDWVVFGNKFELYRQLDPHTRTAMVYHGIGMKSDVFSPSLMTMDVRFVEGSYYSQTLDRMYPGSPVMEVGYAKLDPLFGPPEERPGLDIGAAGLDPAKPTLLYAPTFYPSSIECMPDDMPADFSDCNLIVKPHNFTWSKKRYAAQRRKLKIWGAQPNCWVPDKHQFNLLPFMHQADLMISDASSALFEFAAQDKPVVWCDFLKLRWTYRGVLRYRLNRRMDRNIEQYADICAHAASYADLARTVARQLARPAEFSAKRKQYTSRLVGKTDGRVAGRIVDFLIDGKGPSKLCRNS